MVTSKYIQTQRYLTLRLVCPAQELANIGRSTNNKVFRFGGDPAARLQALLKQNEQRFQRPVVGPLGLFLSIKDTCVGLEEGGRGAWWDCLVVEGGGRAGVEQVVGGGWSRMGAVCAEGRVVHQGRLEGNRPSVCPCACAGPTMQNGQPWPPLCRHHPTPHP